MTALDDALARDAPPRRTRGFMLEWRAMTARTYVRIVGSLREPAWIFTDAVLPSLGMCSYVLMYRALGAPRSYEAVAVVGGILSAFWLNVLWGMGAQLYWEKQQGQLQLYFAAPCSRMAILTGMALGGVLTTTLRSIVGVSLGLWVFHVRVTAVDVGALALVFVITMTALYALGMTLSSLFLLYGREAWHVCNALTEPVYFVSGLFFPIRALGTLGYVSAALVPLALGLDALRQVLLHGAARGLLPLPLEIGGLFVFAIAFLFLARFALERLEALSKHEGRLTLRSQ